MKQLDARTIRTALWGVLLIWIGVMGIADEPAGVASVGAGVILLAGAAFRRAIGARAGTVLTITGALLVVLGFLNRDENGIPLLAVLLIAIGAMIVMRVIGVRRWIKREVRGVTIWVPDDVRDARRRPSGGSQDLR